MKEICIVLFFVIWCITTLILGVSVVGWVALIILDENVNWFNIPSKCINFLIK
jgi:cytochrome c-type biogenesis protein CcmE